MLEHIGKYEVLDLIASGGRGSVYRARDTDSGDVVASGRLWREVPVGAPVGETVLEGFIDLLFEEDGQLVVVDYKTDSLETEEEIAARSVHYRIQAGSYALALQEATGRTVKEVVLLFLQPKQEVMLGDVSALVGEARDALAAV